MPHQKDVDLPLDQKDIDLPLDVRPWLADAPRLLDSIPKNAKRMLLIGRNLWRLAITVKKHYPDITILTLVDSQSLRTEADNTALKCGFTNLELSFRKQKLEDFRQSVRGFDESAGYDVVLLAPIPHKSALCRDTAAGVMRLVSVVADTIAPTGRLIVLDRMYPYKYLRQACPTHITDKILASPHGASFREYMDALVDNPQISSHYVEKGQFSLCNVVQFLLASSDIGFDTSHQYNHHCQAVPGRLYTDLIKILRMRILHKEFYTTPLFQKTLKREFAFTDAETQSLLSTGLYVAEYRD